MAWRKNKTVLQHISIHAPHEGERHKEFYICPREDFISIHAPHEGERQWEAVDMLGGEEYFNPRSPRGGATAICRPLWM